MQKIMILAAMILGYLATTTPTIAQQTKTLDGEVLFNTGAFFCDGSFRSEFWWNDSPATYELRLVREWHGVSAGGRADFHSEVRRFSDFTLVTMFQQDRYAEPNGLTHTDLAYSVPLTVAPGDGLELRYICNAFPVGDDVWGHVTVSFWWTEK